MPPKRNIPKRRAPKRRAPIRPNRNRNVKKVIIKPPTAVSGDPNMNMTIPVPQDQPDLVVTNQKRGFTLPPISAVLGAIAGLGLTAGVGAYAYNQRMNRQYRPSRDYSSVESIGTIGGQDIWPDYSYQMP